MEERNEEHSPNIQSKQIYFSAIFIDILAEVVLFLLMLLILYIIERLNELFGINFLKVVVLKNPSFSLSYSQFFRYFLIVWLISATAVILVKFVIYLIKEEI